MGINTIRENEMADHHKQLSDAKRGDDRLSIPESRNNGERARAYQKTRDLNDATEIEQLENQTNEDEMLAELDLLERDSING